jgi:hypothetical protein
MGYVPRIPFSDGLKQTVGGTRSTGTGGNRSAGPRRLSVRPAVPAFRHGALCTVMPAVISFLSALGGFARETAEAVRVLVATGIPWRLVGIIDDDPAQAGKVIDDTPALGRDESRRFPDARLVVCTGRLGNYVTRQQIVRELGLPRTATPRSFIPPRSYRRLGWGLVASCSPVPR